MNNCAIFSEELYYIYIVQESYNVIPKMFIFVNKSSVRKHEMFEFNHTTS